MNWREADCHRPEFVVRSLRHAGDAVEDLTTPPAHARCGDLGALIGRDPAWSQLVPARRTMTGHALGQICNQSLMRQAMPVYPARENARWGWAIWTVPNRPTASTSE